MIRNIHHLREPKTRKRKRWRNSLQQNNTRNHQYLNHSQEERYRRDLPYRRTKELMKEYYKEKQMISRNLGLKKIRRSINRRLRSSHLSYFALNPINILSLIKTLLLSCSVKILQVDTKLSNKKERVNLKKCQVNPYS